MKRSWIALLSTVSCMLVVAGAAHAALVTRPQAHGPLSDTGASRLVHRSTWEPRTDNGATRRRMPTRDQLRTFWAQSQMPYAHWVTGHFTGTTDEIIQWAAIKWGFAPDLLRTVAATESWWKMSAVGDNGDSFGLFQVRRPYHCQGRVCGWFRNDAAFNADYYGAIVRSYYDGVETWLNTVSGNGARYRPHDVWGSVGAWFSGRWRDAGARQYISKVQSYLRQRVWRTSEFAGGN